MEWAQILVLLLGIALAIFLILAIVLIVILIRITQQIKAVTSSAQRTAEKVEHVVGDASSVASPAFLVGALMKHMKKAKEKRRSK